MFKKAHQRSKSTDAKIVLNTIIVNVSADSHAMGKKVIFNLKKKLIIIFITLHSNICKSSKFKFFSANFLVNKKRHQISV